MGRKKDESAFKIEKRVPIPPKRRTGDTRTRKSKYPLDDMKVGDSFLVPKDAYKKPNYVANIVHIRARKLGIKVNTRTTEEGVRVWRVE